MKSIKFFITLGAALCLFTGPLGAIGAGKLTCCQEAAGKGKECRHKCCVAAHREGKSCTKCNPNKEDSKLKKDTKKAAKV